MSMGQTIVRWQWLVVTCLALFVPCVVWSLSTNVSNRYRNPYNLARKSSSNLYEDRINFTRMAKTTLAKRNISVGIIGNLDDHGEWTVWSAPSNCSRECDGGIAYQTRICLSEGSCKGPWKRYILCNTQPCDVNEPTFEQKQCNKLDKNRGNSKFYNWSVKEANETCVITCVLKNNNQVEHRIKAEDGTRCFNDGTLDTCIEGMCLPVGCNFQLGSFIQNDKCGVCGGKGDTCIQKKGVYLTDHEVKPAYYTILEIPAGAKNIRIKELVPTSNFLALTNRNGIYYLNGGWKIELNSRFFKFGGAQFRYVRSDFSEFLYSQGPINEVLIVKMLHQEKNRGIEWQYSLDLYDSSANMIEDEVAPEVPSELDHSDYQMSAAESIYVGKYIWWTGGWTKCSRRCGGGHQQRRVLCVQRSPTAPNDRGDTHESTGPASEDALPSYLMPSKDENCDSRRRPVSVQPCNNHVCPPSWVVGSWSACLCELGVRIRSVQCRKGALHPETGRPVPEQWLLAEDQECEQTRGVKRTPARVQKCDAKSTSCVPADVSDNEIDTSEEKKKQDLDEVIDELVARSPRKNCTIEQPYEWVTEPWSQCDSRCGAGRQNRTVRCVDIDMRTGPSLPDTYCRHAPKPVTEQTCYAKPCSGVDWVVSQWSVCSQPSSGPADLDQMQSDQPEEVEVGTVGNIVVNDVVSGEDRPDIIPEEPEVFTIIPTDPSLDVNAIESQTNAPITTAPALEIPVHRPVDQPDVQVKSINLHKQPSVQLRSVRCVDAQGHVYPDVWCGNYRKPIERRECSQASTASFWFTSGWSECSAHQCGQGIQTRFVICARVVNGNIQKLPDTECQDEIKPETEKQCSASKLNCDQTSYTSLWSQCLATCTGTRHRSQICLSTEEPVVCESKDAKLILEQKCSEIAAEQDKDDFNLNASCSSQNNLATAAQSVPQCAQSEMGCCPDGKTNATGTNFAGCSAIESSDCQKQPYGCCRDNQTAAIGPFQQGCTISCLESRFGCCPDNSTTAIGEQFAGCPQPSTTVAPVVESKLGANGNSAEETEEDEYEIVCESPNKPSDSDAVESVTLTSLEEVTTLNSVPEVTTNTIIEESSGDDEIIVTTLAPICTRRLKPKKKTCQRSRFGCCPDGITLMLDQNGSGCPGNNNEANGCKQTEFGCCHDNKTIATGPNFEGCSPLSTRKHECESSEWGCCQDGRSKASGPDHAGCEGCRSTKFGCCANGLTPATGPDMGGCPCTTTPYGCCLDGLTPASGANFEGCENCNSSRFGCCEDGKTPARGVLADGRLDCSCDATKFGCCPDRIHKATGPNYENCPCDSLPNGCCPDNKTPAVGPKFAGCDCTKSPFGCCSDNVSVAYGPRGLGCSEGSRLDNQWTIGMCGLPADKGPCRNFTVRWFFDANYGGCTRFWYGGCEGNANNFRTQYDCERDCVQPTGADACTLPLAKGSCNHTQIVWGYDVNRHVCVQYTYGGCLGNQNRFETREACEQNCYYASSQDPCEQPLEPGNCDKTIQKYYFNGRKGMCEPFVYSGCSGNRNNFASENECQSRCGARTARERCLLPVATGNCLAQLQRYYYDYTSGECRLFTFTGCNGNGNRFIDRLNCERTCNGTSVRAQPSVPLIPPYSSSAISSVNPNPSVVNGNQAAHHVHHASTSVSSSYQTAMDELIRAQHATQASLSTLQTICNQHKEAGNCFESQQKFWYNPQARQCQSFIYSGCDGNSNRFDTYALCENRCIRQFQNLLNRQRELVYRQRKLKEQSSLSRYGNAMATNNHRVQSSICLLPRQPGRCSQYTIRWYFDTIHQRCVRFTYSGCDGNSNNFASQSDCEHACPSSHAGPSVHPSPEDTRSASVGKESSTYLQVFKPEYCALPSDSGFCDGNEMYFFYDHKDGICKQFYYGGCGGNGNRFKSAAECMQKCWGTQDICRLPLAPGSCGRQYAQWHFDSQQGKCIEFIYTGCHGNANRFNTKESCEQQCYRSKMASNQLSSSSSTGTGETQVDTRKKSEDVCSLPPQPGRCKEYNVLYFYDTRSESCQRFVYTGCDGNANQFQTRAQCEQKCVTSSDDSEPNESTDRAQEVCVLAPNVGPCHKPRARWYYDPVTFTCRSFEYGGCQGNRNRFLTFDSCINFCKSIRPVPENAQINQAITSGSSASTLIINNNNASSTSGGIKSNNAVENNYSVAPPPPPLPDNPNGPNCPMDQCEASRCHFGIDHYVDQNGCQRCRCLHPCKVHQCPPDQRCAVEVYRTPDGTPRTQPLCRLINKPGQCPPVPVQASHSADQCVQRCRLDSDCRSTDKCCSNGCAKVCLAALPESYPNETLYGPTSGSNNEPALSNITSADNSQPIELRIRLHEHFRLDCDQLSASRSLPVVWTRHGSSLVDLLPTRVHVMNNGSALIAKAKESDAGEYSCTYIVPETGNQVIKRRQIIVYAPATIVPGPREVIGELDQPVELPCNATGLPKPVVTWWKNTRLLPLSHSSSPSWQYELGGNNELRIRQLTVNDFGIYTCQAQNSYGPIQVWDVNLILEFDTHVKSISPNAKITDEIALHSSSYAYRSNGQPPLSPNHESVSVQLKLATEFYKVNSYLQLDCRARGQPQPTIDWYYNGEPVATSLALARFHINPDWTVQLPANNSLIVPKLTKQHSGKYTCRASNVDSEDRSSIDISVEDISIPAACMDNHNFSDCELVVKQKYCRNRNYQRLCCRSCLLNNQISIGQALSVMNG